MKKYLAQKEEFNAKKRPQSNPKPNSSQASRNSGASQGGFFDSLYNKVITIKKKFDF